MPYRSNFPSTTVPHLANGSHHTCAVVLSSERSSSSSASDETIAAPPAAYYSPLQAQEDQLADFFGARRSNRTRTAAAIPPPYSSSDDSIGKLPTYEVNEPEPSTLARFMFLYGFLFPPFWLMGIVILCSELRPTQDWETGKTEAQKARLLAEMRLTEVKWAKRCVWALLALTLVIATIVVAAVFAKRH